MIKYRKYKKSIYLAKRLNSPDLSITFYCHLKFRNVHLHIAGDKQKYKYATIYHKNICHQQPTTNRHYCHHITYMEIVLRSLHQHLNSITCLFNTNNILIAVWIVLVYSGVTLLIRMVLLLKQAVQGSNSRSSKICCTGRYER